MNKRLIIGVFLAINSIHGMHQPDKGPAILFETDSNGDVWYYDHNGQKVKEQYDSFYSSLDATRSEDDIKKQFSIPKPLFVQLMVQASKANRSDKIPFNELLCKIRSATVSTEQPTIILTHKDAQHRLLSYIPAGQVNQLVNGKKIRMTIIVGTRVVEEKPKEIDQSVYKLTVYDDPIDECLFPAYGKGFSSPGKDREFTGEDLLSSSYDFLKDSEHHTKVVAEFNALIRG